MSQRRQQGPACVSLFLPTRNAGPEFPDILARMLDQDFDAELEVLVTNSGSTNGTAEFLRDQPVDLEEIWTADFNHGLTRNEGIRRARGEVVVLAVRRQNISDTRGRFLRDGSWFRPRQLSLPGTPSFCAAS